MPLNFTGLGSNICSAKDCASTSTASSMDRLSTSKIELIIEKLKCHCHRDSTKRTYYQVWKQFNLFINRLDKRPTNLEHSIILFIGHLVDQNKQSSTIKSYLSAIRAVLKIDGTKLNEDLFLVSSLTRACKLSNDRVTTW